MYIIDPMQFAIRHCSSQAFGWKDLKISSKEHFECIQSKVDSFITPDDVGRIPTKINCGFSGFKAEQWRNWTLLFLCTH